MSNHITELDQDQISQISGAIIDCIPKFPRCPPIIICRPWPTIPIWKI